MRGAWPALLCLLGLPAHAAEPVAALNACIERLDQGLDVGFEKIDQRCPGLAATLRGQAAPAGLPAEWDKPQNQLSAQGLGELAVLLEREQAGVPGGRRPDAARVRSVLARIAQSEAARGTWWTRFKYWLQRLFASQSQPSDNWLRRLLGGGLSRHSAQIILWAAMALVILLALVIVLNELRVAGWLRRSQPPQRPPAEPGQSGREVTLAALESTPPQRQPALLLEIIVQLLARERRLPAAARALTTRELLRRADLPAPTSRAALSGVAQLSEELSYGGHEVEPLRLQQVLGEGRELLRSLQPATVRY